MAKFHQLMDDIPKDTNNAFFKSKYASLEAILQAIKIPLDTAGLVFTQIPTGVNRLKTLIIDVESGEVLEGEYEMTPVKNDPQGQGSALTYMRRYSLVAMLGLNTDEDDDGNAASNQGNSKPSVAAGLAAKPIQPPTQPENTVARPLPESHPVNPEFRNQPAHANIPPRIVPPRINSPTINHQPNV